MLILKFYLLAFLYVNGKNSADHQTDFVYNQKRSSDVIIKCNLIKRDFLLSEIRGFKNYNYNTKRNSFELLKKRQKKKTITIGVH